MGSEDEFRKEFEKLLNELKGNVERLAADIEKMLDGGNIREAYRIWRERSREVIRKLKERVDELEKMGESIDEKTVREIVSEFKDKIDEVVKEVSDVFNSILKRFREFDVDVAVPLSLHRVPKIFVRTFEDVFNSVVEAFEDVEEAIEEGLKSAARGGLSSVISARIRRKELELIDRLVDAGIFRSRSEAIAYFVRRGVESSREWIEKALEQAKKIRELQDSIRRELGDIDKDDE
ncbi:MAG: hypothetical protein N3D82_02670 [Ignisphaera sp.]|nr:hypothetical protein [Ignisphaera sp.]MCX8167922.1 hypothetical protein [Ignisphaera sp.]MDW8085737.1 hypothetical protein [Ignisphaera sp.]